MVFLVYQHCYSNLQCEGLLSAYTEWEVSSVYLSYILLYKKIINSPEKKQIVAVSGASVLVG